MIHTVLPLPIGNALRLFIEPPAGAVRWRVLRKGADSFTGHEDAGAFVAYEGDERSVVDAQHLANDLAAFYRPYYTTDGVAWTAGPTASGTPAAVYVDHTTDVLTFLRERVEAGLKVEVERGTLVNEMGYIPVFTGPPSLERELSFPLVSLHLESEAPSVRALGESIGGDAFNYVSDEWDEPEGWLADVRVTIVGWSLNPDERIELRKAIRRIVIGNLPVFADRGWQQVELQQQDSDAVSGEYQAPLFQVMNNFHCVAPAIVTGPVSPIREIFARSTHP